MQTGEDTQGLRKIIDFTRLLSIFILAIHFYICCYQAFAQWHWTANITDRIIGNIAKTGLFNNWWKPKLAALLCLAISLIGIKGKKDERINYKSITAYLLCGLLIYWISILCFYLHSNLGINCHRIYGINRHRLFINTHWRHLVITYPERKTQ